MVDGAKPVTIKDHYKYDQMLGRSLKTAISSGPDYYLAVGRTKITSTAEFKAWRVGDVIHIEGAVTHDWNDKYDFDLLQPGGVGARALQKYRGAKPYKFIGTVRIPNGVFYITKIEWRDVE